MRLLSIKHPKRAVEKVTQIKHFTEELENRHQESAAPPSAGMFFGPSMY